MNFTGREVVLCHFPYAHKGTPGRYDGERPTNEGLPLIHGHIHEQRKVKGLEVNVGVDVWGFAPVPETALAELWEDRASGRAPAVDGDLYDARKIAGTA